MSTKTITEAEQVVSVAIDAIDLDPANPTRPVDTEFVASIKEFGVRHPVIVRPHPNDPQRFRLVAGERRLTGARRAKRTHVPAIVRNLSDEEAVQEQLIENIHRADLAPCQEAAEMLRLVELGMTQKELAKRVGRSVKHVGERLRLLELPKEARRLVDDGTLTVEGGLALTPLLDHPDHLASVLEAQPYNVGASVRAALQEIKRDENVQRILAKAQDDGVAVVEWDGYSPKAYKEVGTGVDVDAKAHVGEPCHAIVISPYRDGEAVPVCTDPKRHRPRGTSAVKVARADEDDARKADERAERKARKEANEQRDEFVAALVTGRFRRTEALNLVLRSHLEAVAWNEAPKVAKLLDLDPVQGQCGDDWRRTLDAYAEASDANLLRACLAAVVVKSEGGVSSFGHSDQTDRYQQWLLSEGYQATPYELDRLGFRRKPPRKSRKATPRKRGTKTAA